jgi:hypothetical protein
MSLAASRSRMCWMKEKAMSNMFNEQIMRSQAEYRREQGVGRLSSWARIEGRRESLLRKPFRRAHRTTGSDS